MLASSQYLTSVSLTEQQSHGVMPTLAAPIIEDVYMVDTYITKNTSEPKKLFWADKGLKAIATSTTSGDELTNILDLGQGMCVFVVSFILLFHIWAVLNIVGFMTAFKQLTLELCNMILICTGMPMALYICIKWT